MAEPQDQSANRSVLHDVVHVQRRERGWRREAVLVAAAGLAIACIAVVSLDTPGAAGALAYAYAYSGNCDGCVPIASWNQHGSVAVRGHRVAQRAGALRALYRSANGGGGASAILYPSQGAPAFYAGQPALSVPGGGLAAAPQGPSIVAGAPGWAQPGYSVGAPSSGLGYRHPPGYRLVWVKHTAVPARDYGGRDEIPYYPLASPHPVRAGGHEVFVPHDCAHSLDTPGQVDPACLYRFAWTDQYPARPLITRSFPHDHYYPDKAYPFIKGPFNHHLVDATGHQYGDSSVGHWVWVGDGGTAGVAGGDSAGDEPSDRYTQRYGQNGR